jgi:hypothetical protein
MTDERTEVRAVLEAVSADPPPTRLSVDEICAAARRPRPRPAVAAWLRRLSVPLPPGRLIAQVVAIAAVAALLPGLVLVGLLTSRHGDTSSAVGGGGAGVVPQPETGTSADGGRAASAGGTGAAAVPQGAQVLELGGIVELSADQRVLSATVSVGGCRGLLALNAQELPDRVLLAATEDVRGQGTPRPCAAARLVKTLTVRLPQPLGARPVLDRGTGRRLPVLDRSKVARVTYVPAGYQPDGDCTPPSSAGADAASAPAVARCATHYSADRPGGGGLGLSVTQYLGSRPADRGGPTWEQPAGTHVHGQAARLRLGHQAGKVPGQVWYTRQLLWTENGVDVTVSSGPADSPDALLSAAEMLRIGDGIRW